MSRVGRTPIPLPSGVKLTIEPGYVVVSGPKGELNQHFDSALTVNVADGIVTVSCSEDSKQYKALHGLIRSLVANMITGVSQGFQKSLDLVGVGYRAQQSGEGAVLQLGLSHPVNIQPLPGVSIEVEGNNRIIVSGVDKQAVGQMAAQIRSTRKPNAYTGKGVRYAGEQIKLKPGKSAGRN